MTLSHVMTATFSGLVMFVVASILNCGARPECLYGAIR